MLSTTGGTAIGSSGVAAWVSSNWASAAGVAAIPATAAAAGYGGYQSGWFDPWVNWFSAEPPSGGATGGGATGGGSHSSRASANEIAENLTFDEILQHGDPSDWKFFGQKAGSGVPATSPNASQGTVKVYEVWENSYGRKIEIHYFRDIDGVRSNIKIAPFSP